MSDNRIHRTRLHQSKVKTDRRILRSRDRLGDALIELIQEKPFESITVQAVLDRAKVSRSTFYTHYSDKKDLFLSDVDEFLDAMSTVLLRRQEKSQRIVPLREFFAHVAEARHLYDVLNGSELIHDFLALARTHFARGIKQRLSELCPERQAAKEAYDAIAFTQAGAMLSLLKWWIDNGMKKSPEEMDDLFHKMFWAGLKSSDNLI
jgi:AcrR family transcriptional regulator